MGDLERGVFGALEERAKEKARGVVLVPILLFPNRPPLCRQVLLDLFMKSFFKRQLPEQIFNLSFIITNVNNKLIEMYGN